MQGPGKIDLTLCSVSVDSNSWLVLRRCFSNRLCSFDDRFELMLASIGQLRHSAWKRFAFHQAPLVSCPWPVYD